MPRVYAKSSGDEELELNAASTPNQGQRKRHICATCDRCFTTSGHLARHSRVHTGEKNHKCPFPGCETRCSRQDNLQQHYRIHLSPGSRRTSSRASASRRGKRGTSNSTSASQSEYTDQPPLSPPPLVPATISASPPPLEPARAGARAAYSPPPDSPPPLAHAIIPATFHTSPSSSTSSSPELSYTSGPSPSFAPSLSVSPPPLAHASASSNGYALRSGATYQEDTGNHVGYPYGHSSHSSPSPSETYSDGYVNGHYSLPRIETLTSAKEHSASAPPSASSSMHSRHSISHISHSQPQQAYSRAMSSRPGTGPPSPASSQSHSVVSHSGPPTPSGFADNSQSSSYAHGTLSASPISAHSGTIIEPSLSRYSPPPILAPLQGFSSHESVEPISRSGSNIRMINDQYERKSSSSRGDYSDRYYESETRYAHDEPRYGRPMYNLTHERHEISPVQAYMSHHQPSAMAGYHDMYSSGGNVSLTHGAWKAEHLGSRGMKRINALVQ